MTLARTLARLRDSVGDGSIDDYYVRFFVGDVRAVVERLDACERVVEAAREFRRWDAILALTIGDGQDAEDAQDDLRAIDAALAALDGREAP